MRRLAVLLALALFGAACDEVDEPSSEPAPPARSARQDSSSDVLWVPASKPTNAVQAETAEKRDQSEKMLALEAQRLNDARKSEDAGRCLFDNDCSASRRDETAVVAGVRGPRPKVAYTQETSASVSDLGADVPAPNLKKQHGVFERFSSLIKQYALGRKPHVDTVREEALRQGVDPALALAVATQESAFNKNARSPVGAVGLMQVMPDTGCGLGVCDENELIKPEVNARAGVRYIKDQLETFVESDIHDLNPLDPLHAQQLTRVFAAYNAGPGAVIKYHGNVPPYKETQDYVRQVLAYYKLWKGYLDGPKTVSA